jgi:DNA topoisomerase VI subunit B
MSSELRVLVVVQNKNNITTVPIVPDTKELMGASQQKIEEEFGKQLRILAAATATSLVNNIRQLEKRNQAEQLIEDVCDLITTSVKTVLEQDNA